MTSKLLRTYYRMAASEPTSSLSLALDTLHPLILGQLLRALTVVWVVPLSGTYLTYVPRFLESMTLEHLELDKEPRDFSP